MSGPRAPKIFLIATEESGDRLGAALMQSLRHKLGGAVQFEGVGGQGMAREGLHSLFAIEELSIIGFAAVVQRLPHILRLIKQATQAVLDAAPDMLVIIDSPDFTHRVARRVRRQNPSIPIIDYVSPTVWAWRPGRAKAMLSYVDHVLALLPFEPAEYRRLQGPTCSYVGHPLTGQIDTLRPNEHESVLRDSQPATLLVLPGSRRSEIRHHATVFGEALGVLREQGVVFAPVLPTTPHLEAMVREAVASWPVQPEIVVGEAEKRAAFRVARAALAKSGTVTLELAISGVPMVTAYRAGSLEIWIARRVVRPGTVILANLVIGEDVVPEFIQEACSAQNLASTLRDVIAETPARRRQLDGFAKIDAIMSTGGATPSERAAEIVLASLRQQSA